MSEIDQFFHEFDRNRKILPESRLKEIEKSKIISDKRDNHLGSGDDHGSESITILA